MSGKKFRHKIHKKSSNSSLTSIGSKASNSKKRWLKLLKKPETKKILQRSWSHKNPSEFFGRHIKKLLSK